MRVIFQSIRANRGLGWWQILGLRKRMEEMQHEFADLLKEALAKMHQRLEASHSSYMA